MFANDRQRKAVMSKYNSYDKEMGEIKKKSAEPLFPFSSEFSKKGDRGSVPLLESTFVIRGGSTTERKKTKEVLDMIGEEPSMESINQIRIVDDAEIPISFEGDRTIIVNKEFLNGGPYQVGIMMLATSYRMSHPEIEEGREYSYAKEVVEPKIKEKMRIEAFEREKSQIDVHRVGSEEGLDFEVDTYDGPEQLGPMEATITVRDEHPEDEVDDRSLMLGVSGLEPETYEKTMEDRTKNMYMGI